MTRRVWFSADHHLGNEGVIKHCKRPFASVEDMDEEMAARWNARVGHDDLVYYLADFTLKGRDAAEYYFARLNGEIRVLRYDFHHDKDWIKGEGLYFSHYDSKSNICVKILPSMVVLRTNVLPVYTTLCHFPLAEFPRKHYGAWHLHGHSHGNLASEGAILDVGVDCWDYAPVSAEEIRVAMKTKVAQKQESDDD